MCLYFHVVVWFFGVLFGYFFINLWYSILTISMSIIFFVYLMFCLFERCMIYSLHVSSYVLCSTVLCDSVVAGLLLECCVLIFLYFSSCSIWSCVCAGCLIVHVIIRCKCVSLAFCICLSLSLLLFCFLCSTGIALWRNDLRQWPQRHRRRIAAKAKDV